MAVHEGVASTVLVLDDDPDVLAAICDLVHIVARKPCLPVESFAELVALDGRAIDCDVAILDVNLGNGVPSGMDAYRWLREHGFSGRICFLTGHARSHPLVRQAQELGGVEVLQKPVGSDELKRIVRTGE